jgi:hypothetical protein
VNERSLGKLQAVLHAPVSVEGGLAAGQIVNDTVDRPKPRPTSAQMTG